MGPVSKVLLPMLAGGLLEWRMASVFHGVAQPPVLAKTAEAVLISLMLVALFTLSGRQEIKSRVATRQAQTGERAWRCFMGLLSAEGDAQLRHRVLICVVGLSFCLGTLMAFILLLGLAD